MSLLCLAAAAADDDEKKKRGRENGRENVCVLLITTI